MQPKLGVRDVIMPIRRLLKDNGLAGPEDVERLNRAYSYALRSLHLVDRNDPIPKSSQRKVIEVGAKGVRDPSEISEIAVKQLGS